MKITVKPTFYVGLFCMTIGQKIVPVIVLMTDKIDVVFNGYEYR